MVNQNRTKLMVAMDTIRMLLCCSLIISPGVMCSDCKTFEHTDDGNCYMNPQQINVTNSCLFERQIVNWTIVNSTEGLVDCEFCLGLNNYTSYEVELYYVTGVNSTEQCINNDDKMLHTSLTYKIGQNASLPHCQQTDKVQFKYVYTGCYMLKIIPKIGSSTQQSHTAVKFIQTDHVKQTYANHSPKVSVQYRADDATYIFSAEYNLTMFPEPITVHVNMMMALEWTFQCPCSKQHKKKETCKTYGVRTNGGSVECYIEYEEDIVITHCRIKNIGFGSYTAFITFLGDPIRCRGDTVWRDKDEADRNVCKWAADIIPVTELSITAPTTHDSSTSEAQTGISLLVVTLILLAIFLALVYRSRKRIMKFLNKTQLLSTRDSESDELRALSKQKVLVLYPRDCPAYMDFMVAFKNLLNKSGNHEVFDIHDESRDYEISQCPEEWVREKLRQSEEYKIILCSTPCAALQTTVSIRSNSVYRHSCYTDGLFPYAIRFLSQNVRLVSYTRLFVVHLGFDTDSYKSLMFNPYTRYGLPEHCASLFADLGADEGSCSQMQDSIEYQLLLSSYKTLQDYITQHPDYLQELLNVE